MIVQKGDPVLRECAKTVEDILSPEIQQILTKMKTSLAEAKYGVALAAPQIGESFKIFIVAGKVFKEYEDDPDGPDQIFINPKIVKSSRKKEWLDEGCLSVDGYYGKVERFTHAKVVAYNENGEKFEQGGTGLLAQIYQHEIDHLNGILFTDTAIDVKDVREEKENE